MDFQHVLSFMAIADELHFGRAAAKIHISQPSLSQQLRRLEREVGVELVARTSHEVRLTAAGQAFHAEAKRFIGQADRAIAAARDAAAGKAGTINIGFNLSAAERVLHPALLRMAVTHPGVTTHLWEQGSGPQVKGLLNGDLDVGFMFGPPSVDGLSSREVIGVRLVAVVGDHHEWAGRDAVVFPELATQACMLCRRTTSPAMYNTVLAAAQRTNTKLRIVAEVDDPGAAWLWVTTQPVAGIASVERARAMKGTVLVPIIEPMLTVPVHAVWRPPMTNHVAALLECVDATATTPAATARPRREPTAAVPR